MNDTDGVGSGSKVIHYSDGVLDVSYVGFQGRGEFVAVLLLAYCLSRERERLRERLRER